MKFNAVIDVLFSNDNATEPVTVAEAKQYCRIDDSLTDDDTLLSVLIKSARQLCEAYVNQSIITRTVKAIVNNSQGKITLPYQPIVSLTSIKNYDGDAITNYELKGVKFKQLHTPCDEYIELEYTTGYTSLPSYFKQALLQQVSFMYEHRGDETTTLSPIARLTLKPYRIEN